MDGSISGSGGYGGGYGMGNPGSYGGQQSVGAPVLGVGALPSAIGGGIIGLSLGLLQGAACEAFGCSEKLNDIQEKYDDHCEWSDNLLEPEGTCQLSYFQNCVQQGVKNIALFRDW